MNWKLSLRACSAGDSLPLAPAATGGPAGLPAHLLQDPALRDVPFLPVGTVFRQGDGSGLARVTGHVWLPACGDGHAMRCPLLTALTDLPVGNALLTPAKTGRSLAWITLSDQGSLGLRTDTSGPALAQMVAEALPLCHTRGFLLPDEPAPLRALLTELALGQGYDLILTSGGTGISPRDISPQTTAAVLDYPLPGFSVAMLTASLAVTPCAAISRAVAGVLGQSIIINLPGSLKAVRENLAAVLPALGHALDKLHGDPADCGG